MKDLVERREVFRVLLKYAFWNEAVDICTEAIKNLPSAQPELAQNLHTTCTDVISKQDAIDALKEHRALYCDNTPDTFSKLSYAEKSRVDELDAAIATLVNLPSTQSEQKWGKWLRSGNCIFPYECDQCGDTNERATPFCPNCGADMREGDSDEQKTTRTQL